MTPNNLNLSETEAHRALQTVKEEKRITSKKLTEIGRFRQEVREMEAVDGSPADGLRGADGGVRAVSSTGSNPGCVCGDVIEAFEGTLNGCEGSVCVERAMAGELGKDVAAFLLRDGDADLTPELKRAVLSSVDERRSQLRVLEEALETEEESVRSAVELTESMSDSLITEDMMISLGFDELKQGHGSLICLKEDCEKRIQERHKTLSKTTKEASAAGLRHMSMIEYLYEELSTEYPVLSTLTEAVRVCERKEREVREYICRVV